jgi:hypothetical protein
MFSPVGHRRQKHAPAEGRSPWWNRIELCLDRTVSVCLDNSRGEIGI